jgi:hypothetical protein
MCLHHSSPPQSRTCAVPDKHHQLKPVSTSSSPEQAYSSASPLTILSALGQGDPNGTPISLEIRRDFYLLASVRRAAALASGHPTNLNHLHTDDRTFAEVTSQVPIQMEPAMYLQQMPTHATATPYTSAREPTIWRPPQRTHSSRNHHTPPPSTYNPWEPHPHMTASSLPKPQTSNPEPIFSTPPAQPNPP